MCAPGFQAQLFGSSQKRPLLGQTALNDVLVSVPFSGVLDSSSAQLIVLGTVGLIVV